MIVSQAWGDEESEIDRKLRKEEMEDGCFWELRGEGEKAAGAVSSEL